LALGKIDEAAKELREAIGRSESLGSAWDLGYTHSNLALVYLARSELDAAYEQAQSGIIHASSSLPDSGFALSVLAQVESARDDWAAAQQHFADAITTHRRGAHRHYLAKTQLRFAEELLKRKQPSEAAALLRECLPVFENLQMQEETARVQRFLTECGQTMS
jgi:tetratricopeptide (TPR) repeat protein